MTGVQTCALPICIGIVEDRRRQAEGRMGRHGAEARAEFRDGLPFCLRQDLALVVHVVLVGVVQFQNWLVGRRTGSLTRCERRRLGMRD